MSGVGKACDESLRNEDGITALELAEQLNQAEVLALLQVPPAVATSTEPVERHNSLQT